MMADMDSTATIPEASGLDIGPEESGLDVGDDQERRESGLERPQGPPGMSSTEEGIMLFGVLGMAVALAIATGLEREGIQARWLPILLYGIFSALYVSGLADGPRRHRRIYLGLQTLVMLGLVGLNAPAATVLFFVLSAEAMVRLPAREGLGWIGLFALITGARHLLVQGWMGGLLNFAVNGVGFLFFGAFGSALARAEAANAESQRLLAELERAHAELEARAREAEDLAVAEERNRLSRELHDTLGHRLTVAAVQLEGAARLCQPDPDRARGMIETVRQQVRDGLAELRATVATLRAPLIEDLPLPSALRRLAEDFCAAAGLELDLDLPATVPELGEARRLALYRTAQEALTNVQRHAGASRVGLRLAVEEDDLVLEIRDDGSGLPEAYEAEPQIDRGFGIRGLRERARRLDGQITLDRAPEGGARLRLQLPLSEDSDG